jgi:sugar phosphate permease
MVIYLVEEVGLAFTLAGAVFGVAQGAGALTRIVMGWLSDRALGARAALVVLGLLSSCALVALTLLNAQSSLLLIFGICVAAGCMSFGWNGVFLAEVANLAEQKDIGTATGGSLFFLYGGIVLGPIIVSSLITMTGGYEVPFYVLAALTSMASLNLFWRGRHAAVT